MKDLLKKIRTLSKRKEEQEKEEAQQRNIVAGVLFLLIGGAMTAFAAYLLWTRVFIAPDLEKILPEKDLVALVNFESFEELEVFATQENPTISTFKSWQQLAFGQNLDDLIRWRGDRGGLAIYSSGSQQYATMTFIAVEDTALALEYLQGKNPASTETFAERYEIYSFLTPHEQHCSITAGYLACANQKAALQNLLEDSSGEVTIADTQAFQAIAAELPRNHTVRVFAHSEPLLQFFGSTDGQRSFLPLGKTFSEVGFTLSESTRNQQLDMHLLLMRQETGAEKDLSNESIAFSGGRPELLEYLPGDSTSFLWGNDVAEDFLSGFQYFATIDPAFELTIRSTLRNIVEETFSNEVSWELDILPLLEEEFVVGSHTDGVYVLFQTNDPAFAAAKAEKLQRGLEQMAAGFIPDIVSRTLADGTVVREMFPNVDGVTTEEIDLENGKIFLMEAIDGDGNVGFSGGVGSQDGLLVFATPAEKVEMILNNQQDAMLTDDLPLPFAGPSEEVFAFTKEFLGKWLLAEQMPAFDRVSGKVVNTPLFVRVMGSVEVE